MSNIRESKFLQRAQSLSFTSNAVTTGHYYNQNPGEEPSGFTSISAGATVIIEASADNRYFIFVTNQDLTFTISETAGKSNEQVQDLAGGMYTGNTETGITATYQDTDGTVDLVVDDLTVAGDSGSTAMTPGDTLTIAGGTGITTAMSGDTLTVTAGASAGWILLATATASASATIDFESFIDDTYEHYVIDIINLRAATATATVNFRVGTGGTPTYQAGATDYGWAASRVNNQGIFAGYGDNSDAEIQISGGIPMAGDVVGDFRGRLHIYDPASATSSTWTDFKGSAFENAVGVVDVSSAGLYGTTAVTAFRILMSSGNVTSGEFKLFGVKKV